MLKIFITIIIIALPAFALAQEKSNSNGTVKFKTSIDCAACVNTIMTNLPQEKGIKDVKCDLKTKEVAVTYRKDKNNPEQIQKSIEKLGYTAKLISEEPKEKKIK